MAQKKTGILGVPVEWSNMSANRQHLVHLLEERRDAGKRLARRLVAFFFLVNGVYGIFMAIVPFPTVRGRPWVTEVVAISPLQSDEAIRSKPTLLFHTGQSNLRAARLAVKALPTAQRN